jgi:glucose/arabinose dehydrogenase
LERDDSGEAGSEESAAVRFSRAAAKPRGSDRKPSMRIALIAVAAVCGASAQAVQLPEHFTAAPFVSGLSNPTTMQFAPDGRLFICEQGGKLRVVQNGALLATPFVSLSVNSSGERGLLGVAFDPDFATDPYIYLYYTTSTSPIHNRISRFTANGNVAAAGSEMVLMDLENLGATNHNGGALHFGKDGKLYVGVGENAKSSNAQTLSNRLGKLLRINKDGSIPDDNPFYDTATGANRAIWALGLRNPFTFAVQPGTGRIFINDVGETTWEEINDGIAGSNYGWPVVEGVSTNSAYRNPLFAYGHGSTSTTGCAIAGGAFYTTDVQQFPPAFNGSYFFADLCGSWIRRFDPASGNAQPFATQVADSLVDVAVGPDGCLYYLARGGGAVGKISYVPPPYTLEDAAGALRTAGGLATADANAVFRLDASKDGIVDVRDALTIARSLS